MNTSQNADSNPGKKGGVKRKAKQSPNMLEFSNCDVSEHNKEADNTKISKGNDQIYKRETRKHVHELDTLPCNLGSFSVLHKILYNNFCFNVGDIVSVQNNDCTYYAQIRIFVESTFCEKYAALIWLLPTSARTDEKIGFDPYTFTYGPQDKCFYNLKDIKFVMHPPTEYYKRFITAVPKTSDITPVVKQKSKSNYRRNKI